MRYAELPVATYLHNLYNVSTYPCPFFQQHNYISWNFLSNISNTSWTFLNMSSHSETSWIDPEPIPRHEILLYCCYYFTRRLNAYSSCWRAWGRTSRWNSLTRWLRWWERPETPSSPLCESLQCARPSCSWSRCMRRGGSFRHQLLCTTIQGRGVNNEM